MINPLGSFWKISLKRVLLPEIVIDYMEEQNSTLMQSAMRYGFIMGLYWVLKYLFYMIGFKYSSFMLIYWSFSIIVPYVAYLLTKSYRTSLGGEIGFSQAWRFGVLIYFFAGLIVSLMHYVFYRYVASPDFVNETIAQTMKSLKEMQVDQKVLDSVKNMNFSPINMAIQGILNNIFYGILFSIPVAFIVSRKRA